MDDLGWTGFTRSVNLIADARHPPTSQTKELTEYIWQSKHVECSPLANCANAARPSDGPTRLSNGECLV